MATRRINSDSSSAPSLTIGVPAAAGVDAAKIEGTLAEYPKPTILQTDFFPTYGLGFQGLELRNAIFSSVPQQAKELSEKKVAAAKESTCVLRFAANVSLTRNECGRSWQAIATKDASRPIGVNLPLSAKPGAGALKVVEGGAVIAELLSGKLKGVVKGAEIKLHVPPMFAKDMVVTLAGVPSWLDATAPGLRFHVDAHELTKDGGFITLKSERDFDKDQAAMLQELGAQPMQTLKDSFREVPAMGKVHVTAGTFLHTLLRRTYESRFGKKGSADLGKPIAFPNEGFESYPKALFDALYEPLVPQIQKCTASFLSIADFAIQFEANASTDLEGRTNPASLHFSIPLASGEMQGDAGKQYFQGNVKIALTIATTEPKVNA
jgi:hypothetical protein